MFSLMVSQVARPIDSSDNNDANRSQSDASAVAVRKYFAAMRGETGFHGNFSKKGSKKFNVDDEPFSL